jgi:signal transduction histidine kinase
MNSKILNAHILIIDDKIENIEILQDLLEMNGFSHIETSTDPRLAKDLYKTFKPDILLLDLQMPYLNGFQVMNQLKEIIPENTYFPILILTADVNPEIKLKALSSGATDFLTKPFDLIEVNLRIKNLLETRFLHQQLKNQNELLDIKVKERTSELENTIAELKIAKNKAEASDRLKTAFMNNISHEIRTPLNGILGFAQFIIQPDITMEEKEEFLDILNQSGKRLMNTVTDFMDISLIVSGNLVPNSKPIDISTLLTSVYHDFSDLCLKNNLEFTLQVPENTDNIFLKTDKEILQKCIFHLVDNAVKFTSKGSITMGFEINEDEFMIFVKDTGVGISEEAKERVFDSFMQENVTNTRGYEGSGLGLSITKGMMHLLGGKIRLESLKNTGTKAFLNFPNCMAITSEKIEIKENSKLIRKNPFILIAEDDDCSFLYLETVLKDNNILRAINGFEAVELCKHHNIDLVLMDIKMPEMNGYDATKQIRQFNKEVVIIAQTAYGLTGDREKAIDVGCNNYISKPIKTVELQRLIDLYFRS